MSADHHHHASPWRRFLAAAGAAVVLLLAVLVASPSLHAWLHHGDAPDADQCAVVLFAAGVTLAVGAAAVLEPRIAWREFLPRAAAELHLAAPRHLRQPERGPPLG